MALKITVHTPTIDALLKEFDKANTVERIQFVSHLNAVEWLGARFKNFNSENGRGQLLADGRLKTIRDATHKPDDVFKRDGKRLRIFEHIVTPAIKKGGAAPLDMAALLRDDPGSYLTFLERDRLEPGRMSALMLYRHSRVEMTMVWIGPRTNRLKGFRTLHKLTKNFTEWDDLEDESELL